MDIQTINQEEFDQLHPAMKEYLKAGIDTNRYGSNLVTENSFFKMDLYNSNPEELDPNLLTRTEKARSKPNYFFAGVKSGLSHGAELIGSIPGGLDRFYDWGRTKLGFEPTEDSIFDHAEDYLKDIAHDLGPEYNKDFVKPEGFSEKFWYGLGMAIPTVLTYHPFIRGTAKAGQALQAVRGVGKTARSIRGTGRFLSAGSSLPAGIAITDITREIDDGSLVDIASAGAYGYGTGKILNVANKLNIVPRMAVLGSTGYLSAGWEADQDDRLASAAVWGLLGILGPMAEGKPIKRELTNLEIQTKELLGMQEKPVLLKDKINEKIIEIESIKKEGIELKEGNEVIYNDKGDTAVIIAFNKKDIKKGVSNDYYVLRDNTKPDAKDFIQVPKLLKKRNKILDKNKVESLESELINLEKVDTKLRDEPVRGALAEKMYEVDLVISQHKKILSESNEAIKFEEANAKRVQEGKEPLPTPENLRESIKTPEEVQKVQKFIKDLELENSAYGKIVWTDHNFNQAIFGFDRRAPELFKQDMYDSKGSLKYTDMKDRIFPDFLTMLEGQQTTGASMIVPAKFIEHPLVKYINDQIAIQKLKTETQAEIIAYDPLFASDKIFAPGKSKLDSKGDYLMRLQGAAEAVRLVGMRKIRSDGGGLTKFSILRQKDPIKTKKIVDTAFAIELEKLKEAKKNGENYSTRIDVNENNRRQSRNELTEADLRRIEELQQIRNEDNKLEIDAEINTMIGIDPFLPKKEGGFKYEISEKELKTKYKFDDEMVTIYREIRGISDKVVDVYNKAVKENKVEGLEVIEKVPNYIPHIFQGDFFVSVYKWKGKKKGYSRIDAPGAGNKASANALLKYLKEDYDALDVTDATLTGKKFNNRKRLSSDYVVEIIKRDREKAGSEAFNAFNELFKRFDLTDASFLKAQEAMSYARKQTGFKKFSLKRQGVDGYLGSELNARQEFIKKIPGITTLSEKNLSTRQTAEFETAILQYLQGGLEAASRIEFNAKMGKVLNDATVISDGKGKTKRTTVAKDYPVAAKVAEALKDNAFGQLTGNKFIEKMSELGSDYIGKSGLTKILGGANQVTLNAKLLFGNMRFLLSQVFQPYHMIAPRLFDLQYSGFDKGKVAKAQIKAFKDLLMPDAEIKTVIEFMYKNGVVDQKFLNEAAADIKGLSPKLQLPGNVKDPAGRRVFDFGKLLKIITLQDFAGKAEQVSRLNASLMFYNFFREAGTPKDRALEMSAYQTNKYMVEYNYLEQPGIYGSRGLGALGKPFGLFKTFQHNYLAQLAQYVTKASESGNVAGLVGFMTQMVFSAGVFGLIGYESAEKILRVLSPTVEKYTGKPLPSFTETILTSSLPEVFKYGAPSSALGIDLTATLAAPGVNIGDLVSVPSLDYLGLNPLNGFAQGKGRGIIPTAYNALITAMASDSSEEKKEAAVRFYSAIAPSSMQGYIEQYYNDLPTGYWQYWSPSKEFKDAHKMGGYLSVTKDPFKRGRGEVRRTFHDWFARTMASYSLEEKEALKVVYVTTSLKRNLRDDISGYLTAGAQHMMKEGFIPLYIVDRLKNYGLNFDQIYSRITNRADLMNTTILDRLIKKTNSMKHNDRINKLRNMAITRGFNFEG